MTCLNTPGTITYARSDDPQGVKSCIDVCFAGPSIPACHTQWSFHHVDGIDSDHFVFGTTLKGFMFQLDEETRLDYRNANEAIFRQKSLEDLQKLGTPTFHSARDVEKIFQWARWGQTWCCPRRLVHINTLHDAKGTYKTPLSKIRAILRYNFPDGHVDYRDESVEPFMPPLPRRTGRVEYASLQKVAPGEVAKLLKGLKSRKAPGEDGVGNEAFKMISDFVQIGDLQAKVTKRMGYLKRISGKTWGPKLERMLQLYKAKVRPVFAFGCAAWFLHPIDGYEFHDGSKFRWRLGKSQVRQLVQMEDRCLREISGVFGGTSFDIVRKQLSMESLDIFLYFRHMTFRIQRLGSLEHRTLHERRLQRVHHASAPVALKAWPLWQHPYHILDNIAQDYKKHIEEWLRKSPGREDPQPDWRLSKRKKRGMKKWFAAQTAMRMDVRFEQYIGLRCNKGTHETRFKGYPITPKPVALSQKWSAKCIKNCKDMSRAESTLYLQLVSGKIGLRGYLSTWKKPEKTNVDSPACPCEQGPHTVDHLFIHCPMLANERRELEHQLGHLDLERMLTANALVATRWALEQLRIEQFQFEREYLLTEKAAAEAAAEAKKAAKAAKEAATLLSSGIESGFDSESE
ncbi:hypothetical protein PG993_011464 [Apiospora rasikravindrae]|uniref:Reverse transcriptase n=1 Tax=Apiospora rasikravindrae TaxID=990691 RepID=A0ABR1SEB8_9PEZI